MAENNHFVKVARDPHTGAALNTPMNNPHERYQESRKADLRAEAVRPMPENPCIMQSPFWDGRKPCNGCRRCD